MATERLRMRHVREILRQKLVVGRSNRQVAASLGISNGAVSGAAGRAGALGLDWTQITAFLHLELRRVGVTLQLLHLE